MLHKKLAEILSFNISTNLGGNTTLNFFANMPEVKYVEILQQKSYISSLRSTVWELPSIKHLETIE